MTITIKDLDHIEDAAREFIGQMGDDTVFAFYGKMGAGKTTAGRILADKLGWYFVDLDEAFKEIHGLSTADYIRKHGLEEFRKKEKYVVEDIADQMPYEKVIYATGGGYPCWEDNMECLKELGTHIYPLVSRAPCQASKSDRFERKAGLARKDRRGVACIYCPTAGGARAILPPGSPYIRRKRVRRTLGRANRRGVVPIYHQ